jgi:hypothetical protein
LFSPALWAGHDNDDDDHKGHGRRMNLTNVYVHTYLGGEDGGLAHVSYWGLPLADPDYYDALSPEEQSKANKINANYIHADAFQPTNADIAGTEVTGLLTVGRRQQSITFRLPDDWNGKLAVAGTPGLRNEYASEAVLVPWLLEAGYAFIAGDKGIPGGANDMISGTHPTQYWGIMMIDLAMLARKLLKEHTGSLPALTYAIGLSNGGYQTRRALEIDHKRVRKGKKMRLFDGGVDWSGAYWPDKRVLDADGNGKVSVKEYAAADSLVGSIDKGTMAMKWFYSPDTLTTEEEYEKDPRFPGAYLPMVGAGFSPESALFWGYYNSNFDPFQGLLPIFRGVGYYNLVSYVYRADLRGDDEVESAAYTCYSDPDNPNTPPPIYDWLEENAENGGWNKESVRYALKNANTGEFSVPMLTLQGQADGLVALNSQGLEYKDAVELFGLPELYRFYIIAHACHVDKHVDGGWGYSSADVDPTVPDQLTPMQAYTQRTFKYLEDWVENGESPPDSKLVETDPANDITDPNDLDW